MHASKLNSRLQASTALPACLPADAGKLHGGGAFMPRPSTFMPVAAAKPASGSGAFTPPLPPNSPGGRNTDGLAEQGGPAVFKPYSAAASLRDASAASAAAAAGAAATNGTSRRRQGGSNWLQHACAVLAACLAAWQPAWHSPNSPLESMPWPSVLLRHCVQGARSGAACAAACCRCC